MPVKPPSAVPSVTKPLGKVLIRTHGCKLNQADSDVIARQFIEAGYRLVNSVAEADVFVLNTCTVTANADAKARQALRAARRANPTAIIVAAGCYPQRAAQELSMARLLRGDEYDAAADGIDAARPGMALDTGELKSLLQGLGNLFGRGGPDDRKAGRPVRDK